MISHTNPPPALIEIVAHLTRRVAELQSGSMKDSEFSDLSLRQIHFLDWVRQLHNPTPSELAKILKISKPSVTAAVDRLESAGYIRKIHSDADRRSYHLHLTEKGQVFAFAHEEVHRHLAQTLTRNLDEDEIQLLIDLLQKILQTPPAA